MPPSLTAQVATLHQRLDDATRRAESLRRVIEAISGELALAPLLTRIIQCAVELIGADDGTISLVVEKPDGPVMRTVAGYNMPGLEVGREIGPGVGLSGLVLQEQRPILLDRYRDLAQPALPNPDDYAVIGMPIWWASQLIGFFGIGAAPPRRFDAQDVETLELFARHAAIAIENARRYEMERRRTEQLTLIARIGRVLIADLPLDELLQSAADAIYELLGYPNVGIPLIDPADPLTLVARTFGGQYRSIARGEYRLPISVGIIGAAARTRQVQLVNDVTADPRYLLAPGAVGIRAELAKLPPRLTC
jgi:GAF domain-containing protein